jgi:hypothetical protein
MRNTPPLLLTTALNLLSHQTLAANSEHTLMRHNEY